MWNLKVVSFFVLLQLVSPRLSTGETSGEGELPTADLSLSLGSLFNLDEVYQELHAHTLRNPGLGPRWNISPIITAFLNELKRQLIAANRYTAPLPNIELRFPEESYNPLLLFTNGTLSGAETVELNGDATLIVTPNFDIVVDIPLRILEVVLKYNLAIDLANGFVHADTVLDSELEAPTEYFIGLKLSAPPAVALSVTEFMVTKKGVLHAEGTGLGGLLFWFGFIAWALLGFTILFAIALVLICYLGQRLRKKRRLSLVMTDSNELTKTN